MFFFILLAVIIFSLQSPALPYSALQNSAKQDTTEITITQKPTPTITEQPMPTKLIIPTVISPSPNQNSGSNPYLNESDPWGVAKQISEHTWTMKIGLDPQMGTPKEIYDALNQYRKTNGSTHLSWDDRLAKYAQSRADLFNQIGNTDSHAGFIEFVKDPDYVNKLGFATVGENSSYGYRLSGVHLIEYVYAGDKPHNDNQLDPEWLYVGIGVSGNSSDLIFGR